jgi:C1A family cysteine protease
LRTARFGWRRDTPDHRDVFLTDAPAAPPPPRVDLRETGHLKFPIYDQGDLGSCTANAIAAGVLFAELAGALATVPPSRLFIYYEERRREGTVASDAGAEIRDGLKVVAKTGYPSEDLWPYDVEAFATKPPASVYAAARRDHVTVYRRVATSAGAMRSALALGFPIVVGFTVYESFESGTVAGTGIVPMPGPDEQVLGGHAVLCVGYDDAPAEWICRNSWGEGWGRDGYFTLPYGYLDSPSLAGDFWTIRREVEAL